MDDAVATVVQLCQARLFRLPLFPRSCLRQALALYYVLTRLGYPVAIHFGVRKEREELHGHSWVTCQGTPVAERTPTALFTIVYSYPAPAGHFPHATEACEMPRRSPWIRKYVGHRTKLRRREGLLSPQHQANSLGRSPS
jgi:hypothetical protein